MFLPHSATELPTQRQTGLPRLLPHRTELPRSIKRNPQKRVPRHLLEVKAAINSQRFLYFSWTTPHTAENLRHDQMVVANTIKNQLEEYLSN